MVDPGAIGSPTDVATFILVLVLLRHRVRPTLDKLSAAVVALAERHDDVDDEDLANELDVDDRQVRAIERDVVYVDRDDGGS